MALTLEQIATLKEGQVLFLQNYPVTYECETVKRNICAIDNVADGSDGSTCFFPPCYLSLQPDQCKPKYDPNRKFRKGDLVRLKAYNGRKPYDFWHKQTIEHFGAKLDTVLADELDSGNVDIFQDAPIDELTVRVHASHLELVTPVEELEPYYTLQDCEEIDGDTVVFWAVRDEHDDTVAKFYVELYRGYGAQKAAEAERDRRNDEWRKEQSND